MQTKEQIYEELIQCGNEMSNLMFLFKHWNEIQTLDKDRKLFERLHKTWDSLNDKLKRIKLQEGSNDAVCSEDQGV